MVLIHDVSCIQSAQKENVNVSVAYSPANESSLLLYHFEF